MKLNYNQKAKSCVTIYLLVTLNCSDVLLHHVTKAATCTGSKPARGSPFASLLKQILSIGLQQRSSHFTRLLIEK
jgi:hypothetical protein